VKLLIATLAEAFTKTFGAANAAIVSIKIEAGERTGLVVCDPFRRAERHLSRACDWLKRAQGPEGTFQHALIGAIAHVASVVLEKLRRAIRAILQQDVARNAQTATTHTEQIAGVREFNRKRPFVRSIGNAPLFQVHAGFQAPRLKRSLNLEAINEALFCPKIYHQPTC